MGQPHHHLPAELVAMALCREPVAAAPALVGSCLPLGSSTHTTGRRPQKHG